MKYGGYLFVCFGSCSFLGRWVWFLPHKARDSDIPGTLLENKTKSKSNDDLPKHGCLVPYPGGAEGPWFLACWTSCAWLTYRQR